MHGRCCTVSCTGLAAASLRSMLTCRLDLLFVSCVPITASPGAKLHTGAAHLHWPSALRCPRWQFFFCTMRAAVAVDAAASADRYFTIFFLGWQQLASECPYFSTKAVFGCIYCGCLTAEVHMCTAGLLAMSVHVFGLGTLYHLGRLQVQVRYVIVVR